MWRLWNDNSVKGFDIMARIYADLIIKGKKTIDDVPEELKEEVIKILMEPVN